MKNQYRGEDCLKRGPGQSADLKRGGEGALGRKRGVVFLRLVDTPMHTMLRSIYVISM